MRNFCSQPFDAFVPSTPFLLIILTQKKNMLIPQTSKVKYFKRATVPSANSSQLRYINISIISAKVDGWTDGIREI